MASIDRGRAVREVADRAWRGGPVTGRVAGVYRRAVYLRIDGDLVAVVSAAAPPGPLHLRCDAVPPARRDEPVLCDGSRITGRTWAVRCDPPTWEGALPHPPPPADVGRLRSGGGLPSEVPAGAGAVHRAVCAGDLEAAASLLGGRGPGLTPAGDDVLAGLLVVARAVWGPECEARLGAVAASVPTTGPAEAFLRWAARGQSVAPAHDWLCAAARGDEGRARDAERRLGAFGASSGRCLVAGMRSGLAQLPRLATQTARAGAGPGL